MHNTGSVDVLSVNKATASTECQKFPVEEFKRFYSTLDKIPLPEKKLRVFTTILIMKANEMHYFSNLFDKVLYMFRTCPLSIIRSTYCAYTVLRHS
jgi:hypothetical protein